MNHHQHEAGDPEGVAETNRLLHFCHDLRQQVATGRLLAATPEVSTEVQLKTLGQLLDDIDAMIAVEIGETSGHWTIDLSEMLEGCVQRMRLAHRVRITATLVHPLTAYGDPTKLRRAILNVLDNAIRAAGSGGEVIIDARTRDGQSVVSITDDGPGFARIGTVTGFGMQIVSEATRDAGGSLHIRTGPSPGTTVEFRLPSRREDPHDDLAV